MLNNIFGHVLNILSFIGKILLKLLGLVAEGIMFIAMFICGALGFGVFLIFLVFMLVACMIAIAL